MSSTVRSFGFLAVAKNPIDQHSDEWAVLYDKMTADTNGVITMNGDGIIECDFARRLPRKEREDIYQLNITKTDSDGESRTEFLKLLQELGIEIHLESIRPYNCIWYNGGDSPTWYVKPKDLMS